ncbi:MAG: PAS domain S-box protein [Lentisphaerae bacterium]|nr:PAS domain S-box protein [Lentisphaerota bacterium]MCP4101949.1 PAS domain S-box protein [Lentisphaerota bacterium]
MESIYATVLAFLEMTFIFVGLGLLHSQRKLIGNAAFYISVGVIFLFAQFVSAAEIRVNVMNLEFFVGSTVLFLPYLAALLLVYATEGTLAAQRMILGAIAAYGLFFYLGSLTQLQCNWLGFSISQGIGSDILNYLLASARNSATGATLAQVLALFLLPIFFQRLRNMRCRLFFCVLGALVFTEVADSVVYLAVTGWNRPHWWVYINNSFIAKAIASVWLSALLTIYLRKIESEFGASEKSALDIVFAFFGGYGRSKALEKDLREWEGRYRMVVHNASEMIMLLNLKGEIIDANNASVNILGKKSVDDLRGMLFLESLTNMNGEPVKAYVDKRDPFGISEEEGTPVRFKAFYPVSDKDIKHLDIAVSAIEQEGVMMLVLVARDITEESRLAREKEKLSEQLAHSQRLEAIGQLAGGIAHDFNNHIHAILGHLDVVQLMANIDDDRVEKHLDKIGEISEQAGKLTGQLLGFARKGKYHEVEIDIKELVERSVELFLPNSQKNLDVKLNTGDVPMYIKGDMVQLQQVLINLLINAKDAMISSQNEAHKLSISAGEADSCKIKLRPPGVDLDCLHPEDYYYIVIRDNGCGMEKEVAQRIFEPFFTTKPTGKGTGMGLAMVYGTISNHHGWVQVKSRPNKGAAFYIFLPKGSVAK